MKMYNGGNIKSMDYPYTKYFKTIDDVELAFANVKHYRLKLVNIPYKILNIPDLLPEEMNYNGKPTLIELNPNDYNKMSWLSNYFNEQCRVHGKRYDENHSPYEYWHAHKSELIATHGEDDVEKLHDAVYEAVRGCNTFRPNLLSGFIKLFGAKSVLDFSSGWGDRLIGAISQKVRYVGVDPNECLQEGYAQIINTFAGKDCDKYTMICAPFQTAELPAGEKFDMIFTSPPYFDLEIYSGAATQSSSEFKTSEEWFNNFLIVSITKAWNVLNKNGHLIVIINNIRNKEDYVIRMRNHINENFIGAKYLGLISYSEKYKYYKSPQPIWIWQKTQ